MVVWRRADKDPRMVVFRRIRPPGYAKTLSTEVLLGDRLANCNGLADTLENCTAIVGAVGCAAVTDVGSVREYCPLACCLIVLPNVPVTEMLPIGFAFPYFDRSVAAVRVTYTGLVHLTEANATGCCEGSAAFPDANLSAVIAPFWEDVDLPPPPLACALSTIPHGRPSDVPCAGDVGATCGFNCSVGHSVVGEHRCGADLLFKGGECAPNPCTAGNTLPHSVTTCSGATTDVCPLECAAGYYPAEGEENAHVCLPNGTFAGGSCLPLMCSMDYPAFSDDFECTTADCWNTTGWNYTESPSLAITTCGRFGQVLGGVGSTRKDQSLYRTYDLASMPHDHVRVELDFIKFDGYNRQQAQILVDGVVAWEHFFYEAEGEQICGSIYRWEQLVHISVLVPHTAGAMSLTVTTVRNPNPWDEYFAIDNVEISATTTDTHVHHATDICAGSVGYHCVHTCEAGYTFVGTHVCGRSGHFDGGSCEPNSCYAAGVQHSDTLCAGEVFDGCDYTCHQGFVPVNDYSIYQESTCAADGVFRGAACAPSACTEGASISHAIRDCYGRTDEDCAYSCDTQTYTGSIPFTVATYSAYGIHRCNSSGVWEGGECRLENVCDIDIGCHPSAHCVQTDDPAQAQYQCRCNYGFFGSGMGCTAWTECVPGVDYETALPTHLVDRQCSTVTQCGPGTVISRPALVLADRGCGACPAGTFQPANNTAFCPLCPAGRFDHDGLPTTNCTACPTGTHQPLEGQTDCPACVARSYDDDEDPATACSPCADGFSSNGTRPTSCAPALCTINAAPADSSTVCSGAVGASCNLTCLDGFRTRGNLSCTVDGAWVGGWCEQLTCTNGTTVEHSQTTCPRLGHGQACNYACARGYHPTGAHLCDPDGTFRGGSCDATACTTGLQVAGSATVCSGVNGDVCNYTCQAGFLSLGVHRCKSSGAFVGGACTTTTVQYGRADEEMFLVDFRRVDASNAKAQIHWQLGLRADGGFEILIDHHITVKPHPIDVPGYTIGYQDFDGARGRELPPRDSPLPMPCPCPEGLCPIAADFSGLSIGFWCVCVFPSSGTLCKSDWPEPCVTANSSMVLSGYSYSVGACSHKVMLRKPCPGCMVSNTSGCSVEYCSVRQPAPLPPARAPELSPDCVDCSQTHRGIVRRSTTGRPDDRELEPPGNQRLRRPGRPRLPVRLCRRLRSAR